jgi:hypothetical protein
MSVESASFGTYEALRPVIHAVARAYDLSIAEVHVMPWPDFCQLAEALPLLHDVALPARQEE